MIEYEVRTVGLSHEQNLANQDALLKAFGKWAPEEGLTVHAFVSNLNNGGYHDLESSWVNSPYIVLPSSACYLQFRHWYDLEQDYDGGIVVILTNQGQNFALRNAKA